MLDSNTGDETADTRNQKKKKKGICPPKAQFHLLAAK